MIGMIKEIYNVVGYLKKLVEELGPSRERSCALTELDCFIHWIRDLEDFYTEDDSCDNDLEG